MVEELARLMSADTPWIWSMEQGNSVDFMMRERWRKAAQIAIQYCIDHHVE